MVGNKKKPIIFDVGAHKGETLIEYKKHFPDSLIYCFEPFEDSFNELTLLRKNYNNVIIKSELLQVRFRILCHRLITALKLFRRVTLFLSWVSLYMHRLWASDISINLLALVDRLISFSLSSPYSRILCEYFLDSQGSVSFFTIFSYLYVRR